MSDSAGNDGRVLWVFDDGQHMGGGIKGIEEGAGLHLRCSKCGGQSGGVGGRDGKFKMDNWVRGDGL